MARRGRTRRWRRESDADQLGDRDGAAVRPGHLTGARARGRRGALALVGALLVLGTLRSARAAESCPAGAGGGPALAAIDPELRLHFIDERLGRTAHRALLWTWGWGIGIGAATVGNLIPLAFVAPENRIDWYVGAGTTIIGIVPLLIAPLDVIGDSRALKARLAARGSTRTADNVCVLLADAEEKLVRDAKNQADGQRWWLHVGNVLLNTGVGLFLGFGYHHWGAGAYNAILGSAIGEAIILSQPTSTIGDLETYRAGAFAPPQPLALGYAAAF
jgi:hypothetical protein